MTTRPPVLPSTLPGRVDRSTAHADHADHPFDEFGDVAAELAGAQLCGPRPHQRRQVFRQVGLGQHGRSVDEHRDHLGPPPERGGDLAPHEVLGVVETAAAVGRGHRGPPRPDHGQHDRAAGKGAVDHGGEVLARREGVDVDEHTLGTERRDQMVGEPERPRRGVGAAVAHEHARCHAVGHDQAASVRTSTPPAVTTHAPVASDSAARTGTSSRLPLREPSTVASTTRAGYEEPATGTRRCTTVSSLPTTQAPPSWAASPTRAVPVRAPTVRTRSSSRTCRTVSFSLDTQTVSPPSDTRRAGRPQLDPGLLGRGLRVEAGQGPLELVGDPHCVVVPAQPPRWPDAGDGQRLLPVRDGVDTSKVVETLPRHPHRPQRRGQPHRAVEGPVGVVEPDGDGGHDRVRVCVDTGDGPVGPVDHPQVALGGQDGAGAAPDGHGGDHALLVGVDAQKLRPSRIRDPHVAVGHGEPPGLHAEVDPGYHPRGQLERSVVGIGRQQRRRDRGGYDRQHRPGGQQEATPPAGPGSRDVQHDAEAFEEALRVVVEPGGRQSQRVPPQQRPQVLG